ncbi:hypothetical protein DXG03_001317 [Asterophora parasitica]|uniref:YTH domain-containing protein n=1 Tax=Asterophora parasitica TaxID=117018 RepID=A0A9P7G6W0_9AGAR|nr:hypothetical protein DXG03_001317 [Asterophora parasitica]
MSPQATPPPPPVPASPPATGGVRRHHTISASSRTARAAAREPVPEEAHDQPLSNDDEVVDEDWVGGVGAVGEKSSLHRQSSLPTRYHRGFQGPPSSGNLTPNKTVNSLAAIAGHEGDEEPWNIAAGYSVEDEHPAPEQAPHLDASTNSPLSPHFAGVPHVPSPPPAASTVRRHVSLTYGSGVAGPRKMNNASGLKRSGTLQVPTAHGAQGQGQGTSASPDTAERVEEDEYAYEVDEQSSYDDEYARGQQQYASSPIGRHSPWTPGNEWRTGYTNQNAAIDDVQRALSALELASNPSYPHGYGGNYQSTPGQSVHPPRFNPTHPPPALAPGMRSSSHNNNGRNLQLVTDLDGRKTPQTQQQYQPYQQSHHESRQSSSGSNSNSRLGSRSSNPNLQAGYRAGGGGNVPSVPAIPQQYLQQQQQRGASYQNQNQGGQQGQSGSFTHTPIDVPSLIATKGYNPTNFDTRPQFARYFVIKSYTEDDVHKSLKYEIWSSTDPGNKRLDKAFKETAGRGPIYLFFSVNASGHFCGMAEMLTPVDYTRSSTVWASDKWKGVFTVRWIFVRDIPNVNLRHIKLNNTQERKPVTNSRDTQELLPDAGQEMLRIFHTHPARTSLLQDFAFYELQAMQKLQGSGSSSGHSPEGSGTQSPQQQHQAQQQQSPQLQPQHLQHNQQQHNQHQQQQNIYGLSPNPNALGYAIPQMSPMMQMQMHMGMMGAAGLNPAQYGIPPPQTQAMHQSVMRHPSPGPHAQQNLGGQGFMGF